MASKRLRERARHWVRGSAVLATLAVAVAVAVVPAVSTAPSAGAVDPQPWSVTATPLANLTDGQPVTMTVKTNDPTFPIYTAEAHVCRSGVTYDPSSADRPNDDFKLGGDNCPLTPISSSADQGATASTYVQAPTPEGAKFSIHVGVGVVAWTSSISGSSEHLACNSDFPCTLVVELQAGNPATWIPWQVDLHYQIDDPVAGCGGPASAVVTSAASDRMSNAWVNWTLAACKQPGQKGALTTASFLSEGDAVQNFSLGKVDMAYSAAGYNPIVNLAPDAPDPKRPAIYVPVAVNAAVMALGNGQPGLGGTKIPFSPASLTLDEAAAIVSGGTAGLTPDQEKALWTRNPEFDPAKGGSRIMVSVVGVFPVEGPAESESSSWFGTNYFQKLTPSNWVVPNIPQFGTDAGKARGSDAALALASPSYNLALGLYTGRPSLRKVLRGIGGSDYGGLWALTDLETANALGMVPVNLQNASGQFVTPDADSLAAAVPTMIPQADGTLVPNPSAAAPVGQPQPYPSTYVEYAMAPAEPLVDADGCARPASQKLLKDWLTYVLGAGQQSLPAGMVPLTAALAAQAQQQLAKVGAAPSTATCSTPPPDTTTTDAGRGTSAASGGGAASDSSSYGSSSDYGSTPAGGTGAAAGAASPAGAELAVSTGPIPDYGGSSAPSGLVAVATLLGIVLLVFGAAALSSGRGRSLLRRPTTGAGP